MKRMADEGRLQKIDFSSMEYSKNIGDKYWEFTKTFDPTNEYVLPYFWGTVGLVYDKTKVHGPVDSWEVLFNGEYKNEILILKMLTSIEELEKALSSSLFRTYPKL